MGIEYFIGKRGALTIVDYATTEEQARKLVEKHAAEHGPDIEAMPPAVFLAERKKRVMGNAKLEEINHDAWTTALEVLPPENWHTDAYGVNKFLLSEYFCDTFTRQYAAYKKRYFTRMVDATDPETYITRDQILAFIKGA